MKKSERIGLLMYRFMTGDITPAQRKELLAWRSQSAKHETAFQEATDWQNVLADLQWSEYNSNAVLEKMKEKYPGLWQKEEEKPKAKIRLMGRFIRAAAIWIPALILIGYQYSVYQNARPHPGTYAAMAIFPNGDTEDFSTSIIHDFLRGFKAGYANVKVVEHENGDIEYIAKSDPKAGPGKNYELRTYRGNAFMLNLTGVGRIWINASTNIWYPANFSGDTLRIKLTGEGYFEMKGNKPVVIEIPPTPHSAGQAANRQLPTFIRETGSFNVHAYPSDSLKVANDEQSAAWKNKMIIYQDASLKTILDEISRWYDVNVEYTGSLPDKKYDIRLPRNTEFTDVIRVLREQGVKLFVNRKNIYVL